MCFRPADVQQDKKCPTCGSSNALTATLCSVCGTELPEAAQPAMPEQSKMPGAFGESGRDGGGFNPNVANNPPGPTPPKKMSDD